MKMDKKTKLLALLLMPAASLLFLGQMCGGGADGGVFISYDRAENWEQKNLLGYSEGGFLSSSRPITNNNENVLTVCADRSDPDVYYYGTVENGLFKTEDKGELWAGTGLDSGAVLCVSTDPEDGNTVFAGQNSSVVRSLDGGDTWETVHTDPQAQWLRAVAVDWFDPDVVYAASENGSVIKSRDKGNTWKIVHQIESPIKQLLMDAFDSRVLYAVDGNGNVYKTVDAGKKWTHLTTRDFYKDEEAWPVESKGIFKLALDPNTRGRIYGSSHDSLVRSDDGGATWKVIDTLIPYGDEKHKQVENLAVDPQDPKIVYFTVVNIIHKTRDGGRNWTTIENFPSSRRISALAADPHQANVLIAGTREIEEQGGLIGK